MRLFTPSHGEESPGSRRQETQCKLRPERAGPLLRKGQGVGRELTLLKSNSDES